LRFPRIRRRMEVHSLHKLGAFGSDLGAVACFFEQVWNRTSPNLTASLQAWYLNEAAYCLRALGRLTESLEPMRASGEMDANVEAWKGAAISYSNLSELEVTLGEVAGAVGDAEQSVTYADRSGDAFQRQTERVILADALHQAGRRAEAETRFREAEQMQQERQPDYPLLYSGAGARYCDLLLAAPERAAWRQMLQGAATLLSPKSEGAGKHRDDQSATGVSPLLESCRAVSQRAAQTLKWYELNKQQWLLDIALDHLTLGRAALYEAILSGSSLDTCHSSLDNAVSGLRRAGTMDHIPSGLLTRAWLRYLTGACTGPESAQSDLDEAWEIAERGPMRLHMADILLTRCRLFGMRSAECGVRNGGAGGRKSEVRSQKSEVGDQKYPWESPQADLAAAEKLINKCGYHRRDEELADAKRAILGE